MKLFVLTLMKTPDSSLERLYEAVDAACKDQYKEGISLELRTFERYSIIEADCTLPRLKRDKRADGLYMKVARIIADEIVNKEEGKLLRSLVIQDFHYDKEDDIRAILGFCKPEAEVDIGEKQEMIKLRKNKITQDAYDLLKGSNDLNLDGFIKFRLNDYRKELREIAEYAVDEFLMDRQYQEFIALLQYFVYIQEAKIPFAHLIHKGGNEFLLFDDKMGPIDTNGSNVTLTVEMLEKDINFEDVIISTLISVSPKLVYIHTRDPDTQVIQTIAQIFENRVELCEYCGLCKNLDRTAVSDYNKG
jgi:putative sporulation protein YtxC